MNILIPHFVIDKIDTYIDKNYKDLSVTKKTKFKNILINLYYFLLINSYNNIDNKNNEYSYFNISRENFLKYRIEINKQIIQYNKLLLILENINLININKKYCSNKYTKSYKIIKNNIDSFEIFKIDIKYFNKNSYKDKSFYINKYPIFKKEIDIIFNTKIELDSYNNYLINNEGKELSPKMNNGKITKRKLDKKTIISTFRL